MLNANKLIISLIAFSIMALSAAAQPAQKQSDAAVIKVDPASKARIKFKSDTWDFGSIPRGSVVAHSFSFKNVGQDTLVIGNVKPTCGCTTAPLSSKSIAPGEEAVITAIFNSEKFNGRVSKHIYVDSNDPINPYLKISFSATINNPLQNIQPTPTEADFGTIKPGAETQVSISILNGEHKSAKLVIVEQPNTIKAALSKTEVAPDGTTELLLTLSPQGAPGNIQQSVTLEAENIPSTRFTIPLKANVAL